MNLRLAAGARLDEADGDGRAALWLAARHSRLGVPWKTFFWAHWITLW